MSKPVKLIVTILVFIILFQSIVACNGDDPSIINLSLSLCKLEEANPSALPYDLTGGINKVVIFYNTANGGGRTINPNEFPIDGWVARDVFGRGSRKDGALVACLEVKPLDESKDCQYEIDEKQVIGTLYNAEYQATLFEGATGDILHTGTISGPADQCPESVVFHPKQEHGIIYGKPDLGELVDFLRPYVAP